MEFPGRTANLMVARLALAVLRVDHTFEGVAFSIRSYEESTEPETKNITKALTTYVVSASISDISIQNLADPVVITLQHIQGNQNYDQVRCAFWDFGINNGQGGWNSSGYNMKEINDLSRSAVDVVNEWILMIITYIGCGISSIFLGAAIVTYLAFRIPAIMVAIILTVKKDLYGTLSSTTPFCWIKDDPIFYISVVAYFCLIFFMNLFMFCTVLAQLNSMKSQSQKT